MIVKFILIYFFLGLNFSNAQDLGVKNTVFNLDTDARVQIRNIVKKKYSSGDASKFWKQYAEQSIAQIKNPSPLFGVTTNLFFHTQYVEMKYSIDRDYMDASGRVIASKGTLIEPLKINKLKYGLLFIDGRDPRQINYALAQIKLQPLKIVLTAGSPYDLRIKYQGTSWMGSSTIPFYFDQRRMILNQLARNYRINIDTVPVKLLQKGSLMELSWGLPS